MENNFCFINPAVKSAHDNGRPKNGMFISIPNILREKTKDVSPGHWRIQAVKISFDDQRILIINSYFPVDKRTVNFNNNNDLLETLEAVDKVINDKDFDTLFR